MLALACCGCTGAPVRSGGGPGQVWVNGRLVVNPPPAAYAPREGDAHPSGFDPASVWLAELRVAAMAAAIARGASQAEAMASGHAAVAAALAERREAEPEAPQGYGAGTAATAGVARVSETGGSAVAGSIAAASSVAASGSAGASSSAP